MLSDYDRKMLRKQIDHELIKGNIKKTNGLDSSENLGNIKRLLSDAISDSDNLSEPVRWQYINSSDISSLKQDLARLKYFARKLSENMDVIDKLKEAALAVDADLPIIDTISSDSEARALKYTSPLFTMELKGKSVQIHKNFLAKLCFEYADTIQKMIDNGEPDDVIAVFSFSAIMAIISETDIIELLIENP